MCPDVIISSDKELKDMDITGGKKYENYLRRQTDQRQWESTANAEDIEYIRCQEQLQEQLLTQHTQVERIIS